MKNDTSHLPGQSTLATSDPGGKTQDGCGTTDGSTGIIRATPKRWIILALFGMNSFNKALQWIQVPAATTKATVFYGVENWVINLTSIVFMISFLFMSWPACLLIDEIGIRKAVVFSSLGASIGSIIKYVSCEGSPNIYLLLLGCLLVSLSEQMIFSVPARLVSVWFPDHQVSVAMAVCIQGSLMGVSVGFMVPHFFLNQAETMMDIRTGFQQIFFWTFALSVTLFLLNYLILDEAPAFAPGLARLKQIELERQKKADAGEHLSLADRVRTMVGQIMQMFKNRDLMLVAVAYGVAFGRNDTIATLMDQTMVPLYPEDSSVSGWTGCLIILAGAAGLPFWGKVLDRWRAYKKVLVVLFVTASLALVLLAYATVQLKWAPGVYLAAMVFGFFHTGFLVAGLDFAIELTYPTPELVTTSLMNVMPSLFGPFLVLIGSYIVDHFGVVAVNVFYLATLVIGFICTSCANEKLNRQDAIKTGRPDATIPQIGATHAA